MLCRSKDLGIIFVISLFCLEAGQFAIEFFRNKGDAMRSCQFLLMALTAMLVTEALFRVLYAALNVPQVSEITFLDSSHRGGSSLVLQNLCLLLSDIHWEKIFLRSCFIYVGAFYLLSGLLPIISIQSAYRVFDKSERKMFWMIHIVLILSILVVCLLELQNNDEDVIRVHYRYLYPLVPLVFLLYGKVLLCHEKYSRGWFIGSLAIFCMIIWIVKIIPAGEFACYDCISANVLLPYASDTKYAVLQKLLLVGAGAAVICMLLKWRRIVFAMTFLVLFGANLQSAYWCYRNVADVRKRQIAVVEDARVLNHYFEIQGMAQEETIRCLILAENPLSEATLECYIDIPYYLTVTDDFYFTMRQNACNIDEVPKYKVTGTVFVTHEQPIQYLVSTKEIDGWEGENLALQRYHLYRVKNMR